MLSDIKKRWIKYCSIHRRYDHSAGLILNVWNVGIYKKPEREISERNLREILAESMQYLKNRKKNFKLIPKIFKFKLLQSLSISLLFYIF